ncbi:MULTISPECIES: hypothetical protein [unclassified Halomonas]|uniref:hypothetical protein n=1 Tax=unclassified Halomonas TaxID=2609666 RepID=UPI001CF3B090|nr:MULTISPECIES: hypothetical protein [unclassified Halomonas]MCA8863944.1 hypothetical protein [Halomonas sp. SBBP1]UZH11187.1 hypothetical protein OM794_05355 [Halomonas sp. BDJS001]
MPNCLYQLAQDFQTLIVGFLGFSGVIFTLYMNARLSRKQYDRNITHEAKTIRTALHAELELARRAFVGIGTPSGDSNEDQGAFFPEHYSQSIYQSLISKIGLLSLTEISAVTEAHALISELPIRLNLLSSGHHESFERPGYIYISGEHAETAMSIYRNFLPKIELAVEALQQSA